MSNRDRELGVWGVLFAMAVCLAGCSSDSGDQNETYRSFKSLPENEASSPEADEQTGEVTPTDDPESVAEINRATGETDPIEIASKSSQETEKVSANDPPPLVAIKPVRADSSESIKENIDNAATTEREIKLLVAEKSFKQEGPENSLRVSYDDFDLLKILNMDPVPLNAVEYFPTWLSALDGKRVRVRGFMYPPFKEEGLKQFILARDNQICCFGKNPKIYDLVYVAMRDGVTASYIQNRPFDVVGTFRIRPDVEDGEWFNLYELEDAIVIDR